MLLRDVHTKYNIIEIQAEGDGYVKLLGTYVKKVADKMFGNIKILRTMDWDHVYMTVVVIADKDEYEGFVIKKGSND